MENKRLFGLLCYLQRQMSRENSELFAERGITPVQMHVLAYVGMQTGKNIPVCQKDIEKHINLRASSVSTLLRTLEKNGYLTREVSDGDARTKFVTLTEEGEKISFKNKLLMDKCDGLVQNALSEEEQETFKDLLNKIIAHIENTHKEVK